MIYYIDGFTVGSNPAQEGGYIITDQNGNILKRKFVKSGQEKTLFGLREVFITNNYTEFLALHDCLAELCEYGDTIFTDSQNSISWSKAKFSRKSKRRDLLPLAQKINKLLSNKAIDLQWVSRETNIAGLVNEEMGL